MKMWKPVKRNWFPIVRCVSGYHNTKFLYGRKIGSGNNETEFG